MRSGIRESQTKRYGAIGAITLLITIACGGSEGDGHTPPPQQPALVMGFAPSDQTSVNPTQATADHVAKLLSSALTKTSASALSSAGFQSRVVPKMFPSVREILSGMENRIVDIGWLDPSDYEVIHQRHKDAVPITKMPDYKGLFIVRQNLGLHDLVDLKHRRVAFGPQSSVPSTVYPLWYLQMEKVSRSDVSAVPRPSEDSIVLAVCQGQADAAGIYNDARTAAPTDACTEPTGSLKQMDPIVGDPQVVRSGLPSSVSKALQMALESLGQQSEGRQGLRDLYGIDSLVKASDADYKDFRKVLNEVEPNFLAAPGW